MSKPGGKRRGTLLLGLVLLVAGLLLFAIPARVGVGEWLMRLWPLFLICAGVVRVMGFAVERKPRSPSGGMILIFIGVLFLAARFHSDLNALQIYGRYWLLLFGVFAAVEVVRHYSHREQHGPAPRLFTTGRLLVVVFIVLSGVLASRIAGANPSLLPALRLPTFLGSLRDSVVGETYSFTDPAFVAADLRPDTRITVNNSYGNVRVSGNAPALKVTLTKGVRAWSQEDARKIAERVNLVVTSTVDGLAIKTNRDTISGQFTTDIQIEVPSPVALSITGSYGSVIISNMRAGLAVKASHGRVEGKDLSGDVELGLSYSDVDLSNVDGSITVRGAKRVRIGGVTGSVNLYASNGSVDLRDIAGPVRVEAPFSRVTASGLAEPALIKTEHARVRISNAVDIIIEAPHSEVQADTINGALSVVSSHRRIQLREIAGPVSVEGRQSSVSADIVHGPVDVKTSHGEVVIKNFRSGVNVETSYRDVTLMTPNQPAANINVANSHGEIKLVMPASSKFQIEAASQGGQIRRVGFSGRQERMRNYFATGVEGPAIKLRTSYKNVTIQLSRGRQAEVNQVVTEANTE